LGEKMPGRIPTGIMVGLVEAKDYMAEDAVLQDKLNVF
jgi:hypothetical protein